jgi:hypothetical protein
MLKASLAANKIHIPQKNLERAIMMPRDNEGEHTYPSVISTL